MATTISPCQHVGKPEIITVSEDEDIIPPLPPQVHPSPQPCEAEKVDAVGEDVRCVTPISSGDNDESISLGDLYIDPEDLTDPLVLEFYRTFLGAKDTTVAVRPPTPPSPFPPRSPSSIDWENENYRPPTPPKPRRCGSFEIQDRQYQHLGMHCYERVWRARILVPRKAPTPALPETTPPDLSTVPGSPPQQWHCLSPKYPPTPGRGWLHTAPLDPNSPPPSSRARSHSPIPPPPPIHNEYSTIPPPPLLPLEYPSIAPSPLLQLRYSPRLSRPYRHHESSTIPPPPPLPLEYPSVTLSPPMLSSEQTPLSQISIVGPTEPINDDPIVGRLPVELQKLIIEKQKMNKGKRYRTLQKVGGCLYRITIKPNSEVQITLVERD